MKKLFIFVVAVLTAFGLLVFIPSCGGKDAVKEFLAYQDGTPVYDIVLNTGTGEYEMKLALESLTGEYPYRDGRAEITSGALAGIVFEMSGGKLKMLGDGFEYELEHEDALTVYALFSAFGIEMNAYSNADGSTAKFIGINEFTLNFEKGEYIPDSIDINNGEYTVKFKKA